MADPLTPARAARFIRRKSSQKPVLGFLLGSGFHGASSFITEEARLPYRSIPGFLSPSVAGHPGTLSLGRAGSLPVAVLAGRCHYYEGYSMAQITFPIRTLAALGVQTLVLTNAAGGIRPRFRPGEFMVLRDHINLMGINPLRGPRPQFLDHSNLYCPSLRKCMRQAAKKAQITLHEGVYLAVPGPSYETPAEIQAFATLGADAVGMSTVPEAMVARACNLQVVGLSCITNKAAGLSPQPLRHQDVVRRSNQAAESATELLRQFSRIYEALR